MLMGPLRGEQGVQITVPLQDERVAAWRCCENQAARSDENGSVTASHSQSQSQRQVPRTKFVLHSLARYLTQFLVGIATLSADGIS